MSTVKPFARTSRAVNGTARAVLVTFAWAIAIFDIFIFVWMLASSVKTTRGIFENPWSVPLPGDWQLGNYVAAWVAGDFGAGAFSSAAVVSTSTIAVIVIASPAAYALSRFRVRGSRTITLGFALGLGVPGPAVFIPVFILLDQAGLVNSLFGLFVVYVGINLPFAVFFLTGFFGGLPAELEEAAALDGAGVGRTYWQIMLPQATPGILTCGLLTFLAIWGETLFALVILQDKVTLPIALLNFAQTMQYNGAQWAVLFAGCVTITFPVLVIYAWFGRRILSQFTFSDK